LSGCAHDLVPELAGIDGELPVAKYSVNHYHQSRHVVMSPRREQDAMAREYRDLHPNFANPNEWSLATVLRHHAAESPEATCLIAPEEGGVWTYAEALGEAERIAAAWQEAGAAVGDRVLIMAANSVEKDGEPGSLEIYEEIVRLNLLSAIRI
jgi:AMP-binding enzyme